MAKRIEYIRSDGGRIKDGYQEKAIGGDCVIRAISHFTDGDYKKWHAKFSKIYGDADEGASPYSVKRFLENELNLEGEWLSRYLGLNEVYKRYGDCIAVTTNHAVAIKDGKAFDTFDSRRRRVKQVFTSKRHPKGDDCFFHYQTTNQQAYGIAIEYQEEHLIVCLEPDRFTHGYALWDAFHEHTEQTPQKLLLDYHGLHIRVHIDDVSMKRVEL